MAYGIGRFRPWEEKERAREKRDGGTERRTCDQCGSVFALTYGHRHPWRKFCSLDCRRQNLAARRTRGRRRHYDWLGERPCVTCGFPFKPVRRAQKYCEPDCAQRDRVRKLHEIRTR
jgi:hypothetical protein